MVHTIKFSLFFLFCFKNNLVPNFLFGFFTLKQSIKKKTTIIGNKLQDKHVDFSWK